MKDLDYSKAYRLFYPAVPVVVASSYGGKISAMAVVTAVSVSNVPPRVGFASLQTHSTYRTILSSRSFSMSWLDRSLAREVELLGSKRGKGVTDKLRSVGLKHNKGRVLEVPVIDAAVATLECSLVNVVALGDHDFVVGEVKAAYAQTDFSGYWQFKRYKPILYVGSPDRLRMYDP
ncbi:MAG: flavin reductase family protein [Thaumarchaeota archaeon]|nr:flavin reductase family protein [Nitrososphaerota archaeon]